MWRSSGHRAAVPDIAASTWSQRSYSRQIRPIAGSGSMAFEEGVPTVAGTRNGVLAAPAPPRDLGPLLERRRGVGGGVRDEVAAAALLVRPVRSRPLARGEKSAERGARGRVLDDAPTLRRGLEEFREAEHVDGPAGGGGSG